MGYKILTQPLTVKEMREQADENNQVEGHILVDLSDAIDHDFETFLDIIAEKFVNDVTLMNVNYTLVGVSNGEMVLKVSGDVSMILDMCED